MKLHRIVLALSSILVVNAMTLIDQADSWLKTQNLNQYGDPEGTMYMGGNPLFDEKIGQMKDRLGYLTEKFPTKPWMTETEE